jgi:hypothetical protein
MIILWWFVLSVFLVFSCCVDFEGSDADVATRGHEEKNGSEGISYHKTTQYKTTEDNEGKNVNIHGFNKHHIRTALGFNKHHIRTALDFIGIKPINAKEMTEYIFLHSSNLHQQQPLSSQPLPGDAEEGSALSCVALSSLC